jgi:hypothetical protein
METSLKFSAVRQFFAVICFKFAAITRLSCRDGTPEKLYVRELRFWKKFTIQSGLRTFCAPILSFFDPSSGR